MILKIEKENPDLVCPISACLMRDPVYVSRPGKSDTLCYDRKNLNDLIRHNPSNPKDPRTNEPFGTNYEIKQSFDLRSQIETTYQLYLSPLTRLDLTNSV